jgi:hypothetical protein
MCAAVSNHKSLRIDNPCVGNQTLKSEVLAQKTEKIAAPVFKVDPPIAMSSSHEKEKKNSYIPIICASLVIFVCGVFYVHAVQARALSESLAKSLQVAERALEDATQANTILCKNLCNTLRANAMKSDDVDLLYSSDDALLQCQVSMGNQFCVAEVK